MKKFGGAFVLERSELIRINALVQNEVDWGSVEAWWLALDLDEQNCLARTIMEFSHHLCLTKSVWIMADKALSSSDRTQEDVWDIVAAGRFGTFHAWMNKASLDERIRCFKHLIYFYSIGDSLVRKAETLETCNHWWHRNLSNPHVIEELSTSSEWRATSPKDDLKFAERHPS